MSDPAEDIEFENGGDLPVDDDNVIPLRRRDNDGSQKINEETLRSDYRLYKALALRARTEESESNWLVSYADMMTLLVGFFVMLLAFSKIDSSAFEKIKQETTKIFGGEYKIPFEEVSKKLKDVVKTQNLESQVLFQETDKGIDITFRGALFFDSGLALLKPQAKELLEQLIPTIQQQAQGFGIVVEGHTDNIPIGGTRFPSNWELSSVRACTVLRLFEEKGFPKDKLKALGWGQTRPIVPNEDADGKAIAENQAQNRRVVIKILKDFEGS